MSCKLMVFFTFKESPEEKKPKNKADHRYGEREESFRKIKRTAEDLVIVHYPANNRGARQHPEKHAKRVLPSWIHHT